MTSLGSSPVPSWAGSTYLRVVRSDHVISLVEGSTVVRRQTVRTFLLVYLDLHVVVDAKDDQI